MTERIALSSVTSLCKQTRRARAARMCKASSNRLVQRYFEWLTSVARLCVHCTQQSLFRSAQGQPNRVKNLHSGVDTSLQCHNRAHSVARHERRCPSVTTWSNAKALQCRIYHQAEASVKLLHLSSASSTSIIEQAHTARACKFRCVAAHDATGNGARLPSTMQRRYVRCYRQAGRRLCIKVTLEAAAFLCCAHSVSPESAPSRQRTLCTLRPHS